MSKVKTLFKTLNALRGVKSFGNWSSAAAKSKGSSTKNLKEYGSKIWDLAQKDSKETLEYMARFKSPVSRVTKKPPKEIRLPEMQTGKSTIGAGIRTSLGNTADALLELGKNTKGKNIIEGSKQVGKNTKNLISSQVRGDLYKEVMKPTVYKSKGKAYLKSKAPFLKDREVVTTTNRDSVIVRKRKILTPISIGLGGSGASIGTASYALSDKNKPQSKRLSEAAVDTALFTVSAPVGLAVALGRVNDSTQRKKQKEKI